MDKIKIGISSGDINGIGIEVMIKALSDSRLMDYCIPIVYASTKVVSYHKNIVQPHRFDFQGIQHASNPHRHKVNIITVWDDDISITLGQGTESSGKFAYTSLDRAVQDLKKGDIDALVTLPINKKIMQTVGFPYPGHTEYLTTQFEVQESLMLMVQDDLRVAVATNHIPISDIPEVLTRKLILKKTQILQKALRVDFGIEKPRIALLGLNPHAGDQGAIGEEEEYLIKPVISELSQKGVFISGPHPGDGFFGAGHHTRVDATLAMYHDQGLIPFKTLSFGNGVNYTAGLPIIRTSPDHGTGFDIAGQNIAEPKSFRNALFLALDIYRNRQNHITNHENSLTKKKLDEDTGEDEPIEQEIAENP